jgi:methylmalonyl-CoA/ethylmalonyl-CoA epimerase
LSTERPRKLDHVGIVVADTAAALLYFEGRLGLSLVHQEELEEPRVRLTYLDAGNVFIQLVEPLDDDSVAAAWLREHGDGVHHLCFAYPDAIEAAVALGEEGAGPPAIGSGRGKRSAFVAGAPAHGVRLECTDLEPGQSSKA